MQVRQELRNMDNDAPKKLVGATDYWARRLPKTAAKGAIFREVEPSERAIHQAKIRAELDKLVQSQKKPEKRKSRSVKGRIAINTPGCPSVKRQIDMEALESRKQRRDRQETILTGMLNRTKKRTIAEIVLGASYVCGEPVSMILGLSRRRKVVRARAVVCVLARLSGYSFPVIGNAIGRDHSSVMNLCSKLPSDIDLDLMSKKTAAILNMDLFQ